MYGACSILVLYVDPLDQRRFNDLVGPSTTERWTMIAFNVLSMLIVNTGFVNIANESTNLRTTLSELQPSISES